MKSITIHGIDDELQKKLAEKSKEYGLSQNKTVKSLLQRSLSVDSKTSKRESFAELFGKWTRKEQEEFENRISDFEKVHEADWLK